MGKETQGMGGGHQALAAASTHMGKRTIIYSEWVKPNNRVLVSPDCCLACCYLTLTCSSSANWLGGLCFNTPNEKRPKIFWAFPILTVYAGGMVSRASIHCPCFTFRGNRVLVSNQDFYYGFHTPSSLIFTKLLFFLEEYHNLW